MTLVDANVLLYSYDESSSRHAIAKAWLEEALSGTEPVGFPWLVILAFLRICTNPRVFAAPLTREEAVRATDHWLAESSATIVEPTSRHWEILRGFVIGAQAGANLTTDAHLAALTIEHGATLVTTDRDFARFPKLRYRLLDLPSS